MQKKMMTNMENNNFGYWLKIRMAEMNLGVGELAKFCDTDISTVSCWRSGKQLPSAKFTPLLSKRLCVKESLLKRRLQR